jgi:DNA-binding MarR family transcriptional regulator
MARPLLAQAHDLQRTMARLVRKYQFRDRNETVCHGLSVAQAYALRALSEEGPLAMGELASELRVSLSTMTRVVDPLVRKRLARRVADPGDRRLCRIVLSDAGARLWSTIERDLTANDAEVLRGIPPAEREVVIRVIGLLSEAVDVWRARQQVEA